MRQTIGQHCIQIISASAGSGKTYRLAELLEEEVRAKRARPDAILATTFTKKAAAELQERVRTRLLAAGLKTEAQQLFASRIGTVNSVCGSLLTDFAFDLGISPDQKVLEEKAVSGAINRALARVVDKAATQELLALERRFPGTESRKMIETIIAKARANGLSGDELLQSGEKSIAGFEELFGNVIVDQKSGQLEKKLVCAINTFLKNIDPEFDTTKTTRDAVTLVNKLKTRIEQQKELPWAEWLRLARLKNRG
ncbi:MAG: UvrD-helicase domain-containing protein [Pseudomonadota bacterium]|nr:UvrD-helicase domain-containing protein [Pseudomonadota bacterium]